MHPNGLVSRHALAGLRAACEALFPENDLGAPDWKTTEMVPRTLAYLDELPVEQRRLLTMLFLAVELGSVLLVSGFRRFSTMSPLRRAEVVRGWRRSRYQLFRVLGDALKATTTMMYMSHPRAIAYIDMPERCDKPGGTAS